MPIEPARPKVFVGSSTEGLDIAKTIQLLLHPACEVEIWSQGVFGLSQGNLESLVLALERFDFAILVLTADDLVVSRGATQPAARDNVIFELGLFVGGIGRDRTFMVYDSTHRPALPSDLAGVTAATYVPNTSGNRESALGPACTRIQREIEHQGVRTSRQLKKLSTAADHIEGAGARMRELIALLARSRKVELDVITAQFGALIEPGKLEQIKKDMRDLESMLQEQHPES